MERDVRISDCCVVRKRDKSPPNRKNDRRFNLRIGDDGCHREAALLTVNEARVLRAELDEFITPLPEKRQERSLAESITVVAYGRSIGLEYRPGEQLNSLRKRALRVVAASWTVTGNFSPLAWDVHENLNGGPGAKLDSRQRVGSCGLKLGSTVHLVKKAQT